MLCVKVVKPERLSVNRAISVFKSLISFIALMPSPPSSLPFSYYANLLLSKAEEDCRELSSYCRCESSRESFSRNWAWSSLSLRVRSCEMLSIRSLNCFFSFLRRCRSLSSRLRVSVSSSRISTSSLACSMRSFSICDCESLTSFRRPMLWRSFSYILSRSCW